MTSPNLPLGRREFITATSAAGLAASLPSIARGQSPAWHSATLEYLNSLARPDGGYAADEQGRSHLTSTYAVVGCYRLLGQKLPSAKKTAEFIRTHHPAQLKKLEQEHRGFDLEQIEALLWLDEDVSSFRDVVLSWKTPVAYLKQYEQHGYPALQQEVAAIIGRKLLGLPMPEIPVEFIQYLYDRRRTNGSFNNTPASDGSDGHVLNTWWGLRAFDSLGRAGENKDATIAWLQKCQLPVGGYTYQPGAEIGGVDAVIHTWAAVKSLALLGASPSNREACIAYLHALAALDGAPSMSAAGFGDRRGWFRNPIATYYAIDSLATLGALGHLNERPDKDLRRTNSPPPASNLQVFTIQIESHGQGSPAEAIDLASSLRVHLWGAKNAKPEWLARAQALADQKKVPVKFFVANEEYGTWINLPGMGTYSHMSDIIAPAGVDIGPSLANQGVVSWQEYRERRLKPLLAAGGRLIWQFGENEALVRMLLDDSIERGGFAAISTFHIERGGFAAISTFHFGNPDFTNTEPFLNCYRGQLPFVALQDAHGPEPWWFADMTSGFRTLFLAAEPTWEDWLTALKNNWVVAVRHDAVSGGETWIHGGNEDAIRFVRERASEWQWWDDVAPRRPLVSLVAVAPQDQFEVGRPESGIAIRVRCAFENTTQGLAKKPLAELVRLDVDGAEVKPKLVERRRPNGNWDDHYHLYHIAQPTAGKHAATATVRDLATKRESQRTIEFTL